MVHDASAGLAVTGKISGHVLDDDTEAIIALGTESAAHIEDMNEGSFTSENTAFLKERSFANMIIHKHD